jgi:hypothetical protein
MQRVTVTWPSGRRQDITDLTAGRWWRLVEGKGVEPRP